MRRTALGVKLHHVVLRDVVLIAPPIPCRQPQRDKPIRSGEFHHDGVVIGRFYLHGDAVHFAPDRGIMFVPFVKAEFIPESERFGGIGMPVRPADSFPEIKRQHAAIFVVFPRFGEAWFQTGGIEFPTDERRVARCHLPCPELWVGMESVPGAAVDAGFLVAIKICLGNEWVFRQPFGERR